MQTLIILDYRTREVHTFEVEDSVCIDSEFVSKVWTFDASDIEWMVAPKLNIIKHQGIYK